MVVPAFTRLVAAAVDGVAAQLANGCAEEKNKNKKQIDKIKCFVIACEHEWSAEPTEYQMAIFLIKKQHHIYTETERAQTPSAPLQCCYFFHKILLTRLG